MKIKYNYTLYNKANPLGVERQAVAVGELCKKPEYLGSCDKGRIFIKTKTNKIHIIETSKIFEINGRPFTPCCLNCALCYEEYGYTLCKKHEETEERPESQFCDDYKIEMEVLTNGKGIL